MTEKQKSLIGKAFGIAIAFWAIITIAAFTCAFIFMEPIIFVVGVAGCLGCIGLFGIAQIIHERLYK